MVTDDQPKLQHAVKQTHSSHHGVTMRMQTTLEQIFLGWPMSAETSPTKHIQVGALLIQSVEVSQFL